jgi:hypothetical protein
MATDTWLDGGDNWTTASDWSNGVPTATSDVVVNQGSPTVTAPFRVASLVNSAIIEFSDAGVSHVSGAVTNSGDLHFDLNSGGGSGLSIGGLLTNSNEISIGNASLSADDRLTAAALNNISGEIDLIGSSNKQASLDIAGPVSMGAGSGVLSGAFTLAGDALLEFGSGQFTTIAAGSDLSLTGPHAFVADAGATSSNSALRGLSVNDGNLELIDDVQVSTSGALDNALGATISLDLIQTDNGPLGGGGSNLSIGGVLTNGGQLIIGGPGLTANDSVTARGVDNLPPPPAQPGQRPRSGGLIYLDGGASQAKLDITGGAALGASPGLLTGDVSLSGDSLIEFGWGQITTIAGDLYIGGPEAFVADACDPHSNSALRGLSTVDGLLSLGGGAVVKTTGALTSTGSIFADGSDLDIGGELTNSGLIDLDLSGPSSPTLITAKSLDNDGGAINFNFGGTGTASLVIDGAAENTGTINVGADSALTIHGRLSGSGTVNLYNGGELSLDAKGSGGTIAFDGGAVDILSGVNLGNVIAGFGAGDTLDFQAAHYAAGDHLTYSPNSSGSGGTAIIDSLLGKPVASFAVTGSYTAADFALANDGHGGILVSSALGNSA